MDIILILLPACLILAGISVAAFFWAVKSGQMDDLKTPAIRMLFDDNKVKKDKPRPETEENKTDTQEELDD